MTLEEVIKNSPDDVDSIADAVREYVLNLIEEAQGDPDFIIWSLIRKG